MEKLITMLAMVLALIACSFTTIPTPAKDEAIPIIQEGIEYQSIDNFKLIEYKAKQEVKIETLSIAKELIELPNCATNMYTFMDYKTITDSTSNQWKLQYDNNVSTNENGIRIYTKDEIEYYIVALGSVCGTDIGVAYKVTLDNGSEFNIIMGDCKAGVYYGHSTINYDGYYCVNMIEFIVNENYVPNRIKNLGTYSGLEFFNGNIASIEKLGKIWEA